MAYITVEEEDFCEGAIVCGLIGVKGAEAPFLLGGGIKSQAGSLRYSK